MPIPAGRPPTTFGTSSSPTTSCPPATKGWPAPSDGWRTFLASIGTPEHRRIVQAYAAWQVMRRLRRRAEASPRPRTHTAHARNCLKAAAAFLAWLDTQGQTLARCRQADADRWLSTAPSACYARDFLLWAADHHHCPHLQVPPPPRTAGPATSPQQRWDQLTRLLHDDSLDIVDRVAGCLLLLFGQQQSRIAAMTTDQVIRRSDGVFVHLGKCEIPTPEPLGGLLIQLTEDGKSHTGVGSPHLPARPARRPIQLRTRPTGLPSDRAIAAQLAPPAASSSAAPITPASSRRRASTLAGSST